MPHFRTLRDIQFTNREDDIRGATLYGVDNERLGKIDDVIFDHASGAIHYAVVDTGRWLSHRKFLVPADRIHNYEPDPNAFQVDMVKKHVERLPPFERSLLASEDDWRDYERNYREWVTTGDIIHRRDNLNIVTPPPEEIAAEPLGSLPDVAASRVAAGRWARLQEGVSSGCRESGGTCPECERQRRAA